MLKKEKAHNGKCAFFMHFAYEKEPVQPIRSGRLIP